MQLEMGNGICRLTLNSPENLNALSGDMVDELDQAMDIIQMDDEIQVVIVTGAGKAFVAGADIAYMKEMTPAEAAAFARKTNLVYEKMEKMNRVFIAAVNGYALGGGCELALACDLRLASSKAVFALPETGLGIIPGGGGTQRLQRLIGPGKAKEIIFTGKTLRGEEAEKIGLTNGTYAPDELINKALEMAAAILRNSNSAVRYAKECLNRGADMDLDKAIDFEKNLFALCFATEDQKEGMTAFLEKRPPSYSQKGEKS